MAIMCLIASGPTGVVFKFKMKFLYLYTDK
jgi:hypothetical protein